MQQQNNDTPLNKFRITKRWNVDRADYGYILEQAFEHTEYRNQKPITIEYFRAAVQVELDEEKAKKNAEHYGIEMPTEEHDWFKEMKDLEAEREELGL